MKSRFRLIERAYKFRHRSDSEPGTANWLINCEIRFGGKSWGIRTINSPNDSVVTTDTAVGGDRMLHHGYAKSYENYLESFTRNREDRYVLCEVGVLEGTGLAIWCELFFNSRCIGLDIDLSNVKQNFGVLQNLGAFSRNEPELHEYDQLVASADYLGKILNGDKIDIFMDDGAHTKDAIMTTLESVTPYLNEKFVYFVEDNWDIHKTIEIEYPQWTIYSDCELTVITP